MKRGAMWTQRVHFCGVRSPVASDARRLAHRSRDVKLSAESNGAVAEDIREVVRKLIGRRHAQ